MRFKGDVSFGADSGNGTESGFVMINDDDEIPKPRQRKTTHRVFKIFRADTSRYLDAEDDEDVGCAIEASLRSKGYQN
ncbi:MAG: hypothetical protein GYA55_00585 [SAR324 cluster bacterium]|uniref:Uncharacterized protein n=1 Tax=SAR324 cluster bacterium TaxID=2024889 RepID=A0A7X9FP09_9DELT|nr:hypothetical protein [SAR324 cluster bacterium]